MIDPQALLSFITGHKRQHGGDSPTIREIQDAFNIGSTSTVTYWLDKMAADGLIKRRPGRSGIIVPGWEYRRVKKSDWGDSSDVCPICDRPESEHELVSQCPMPLSTDVEKLQDQLSVTRDLLAIREEQLLEEIHRDDNRAIIEDFVRRVCERAEAAMAQGHKLEGAHYAAMMRELSLMLHKEIDNHATITSLQEFEAGDTEEQAETREAIREGVE